MNFMRRFFLVTKSLRHPYWVKIKTQTPKCLYYFGPFDSEQEAEESQPDYVDDLLEEGAKSIETVVEKADPEKLTVCDVVGK